MPTPPLTSTQLEILNKEFYTNKNLFGRDKLYFLLRDKYPKNHPSRRQINEWLKLQEINQLYHPSKGKPKEYKSNMTTPHKILGLDLLDLQKFQVNNYKYLLNGIDLSTRYLYSVALKNKTDKEVLEGFKKIHKQVKDLGAVKSDNGSEFINEKFVDYLERSNIKQVLSEAGKPQTNGHIERINGTIKELIQKSRELNNNFNWVTNLNKLVSNINNTYHRITKETPKELEEDFRKNRGEGEKVNKAYDTELKNKNSNISKKVFNIGDTVRLYQPSDKTRQNWSNELYEIEKIYAPKKPYGVYEYKVKEFSDKFKEEELLKVKGIQNKIDKVEKYTISKLIEPVIKNNTPYYIVKWKNYNKPTLEPRNILMEDVPKMVSQYEKKNRINFYQNTNKKTGKVTWKIDRYDYIRKGDR